MVTEAKLRGTLKSYLVRGSAAPLRQNHRLGGSVFEKGSQTAENSGKHKQPLNRTTPVVDVTSSFPVTGSLV